jgi:ABC-2 type transport system permease protein
MTSGVRTDFVLFGKEVRELQASRAFWLMLALLGPLVGHAFITAVSTYGEASRGGLPQALSPLDGIVVPTFGAYDLAAMLFFPFVAIRLAAAERESGAWQLLLQGPVGVARMMAIKAVALTAAWIVAWTPGILALALWRSYGGHVSGAETLNLLAGYLLRGTLTIGVSLAAAAMSQGAASAAIVTLAFTVGTWALDFVAAGRGGLLQVLAGYTPAGALRAFETGLFSPARALMLAGVATAGVAAASIWMRTGDPLSRRLTRSLGLLALLAAFALGVGQVPASADRDVSEDRRNSFPATDDALLRGIQAPLHITVHLAAEDPRLNDLERNVLAKLKRAIPHMSVEYAAQSRTGLFETSSDASSYGEIWYEIGGRRQMTRSTTEAIVLETVYKLAGVDAPRTAPASAYSGYPLDVVPRNATALLITLWPFAMAVLFWLLRGRS